MFEQSSVEPQAGRRSVIGADQGDNITAVVYAEFENLMEIDSNRTVQYNIYQV